MQIRVFGFVAGVLLCASGLPHVSGQSLLQQIAQQLNNRVPPEPLAPPRELEVGPQPGAPSLGLRVVPVTDEAARVHRLPVRRGALITAVDRGSPADRAGLPPGGVIVAWDGRRIDSPDDLARALRTARVGQEVELTFYERDRLARRRIQLSGDLLPPSPTDPRSQTAPGRLDPLIPPSPNGDIAPPALPRYPASPESRALPESSAPLERQLGGGGARPLLGRIGRLLDGVVAPAEAVEPVPPLVVNRVDPNSEVALLRQQVEELRRQVQNLQRHVESLDRRLSERR